MDSTPKTVLHERRAFTLDGFRVSQEGDVSRLIGHAAVFNQDSEEMWGFIERIAPGAFTQAIQRDDVRALFNHDPNYVLGRNRSGTLSLAEDATGLAVTITPPDTGWARDLIISIERGDITQMSFGFRTVTDEWHTENEKTVRTLREVKLFDVSPVTFPAYPDTDVSVRSLEDIAKEGKLRLENNVPATLSSLENLRMRLALANAEE